jgi:hypothetical protein
MEVKRRIAKILNIQVALEDHQVGTYKMNKGNDG